MNAETELVHHVWEQIRELIPAKHRPDAALAILKQFEDYGFDHSDLAGLEEEDVDQHMRKAFENVFEAETESEETETEEDGW